MRILSVCLIWLFLAVNPIMLLAAGGKDLIPSNIVSATVYLSGAESIFHMMSPGPEKNRAWC